MADTPGFVEIPVPNSAPFAPMILYTIVAWGKIDELVDAIGVLLRDEPACAGIPANAHPSFNRRLTHFERLACAYFSPAPAMVEIIRRKCGALRHLKHDRDHFAHGRYGIEGNTAGEPVLRVSVRDGDRFDTRKYTRKELLVVAESIGNILFALLSISKLTFESDAKNLREKWKIPEGQVAALEELLHRLQQRYIQTDLERLQKSAS